MFYLTLVAAQSLAADHIEKAADQLRQLAIPVWLSPGKAADIPLEKRPDGASIRVLRKVFAADHVDVFVTAAQNRRKRLLIADMDSTIVEGETLDELAAHAGLKEKISAITARAMNGEIDFETALRERVALLRGLPESAIKDVIAKTKLNPGARVFVRAMKKHGAACVLVSGGFTLFTSVFANQAGFSHHHGNTLELEDGKLTGQVAGEILDKNSKLRFLREYAAGLNLQPDDVLSIGDGANDLPMLQAAGLGVGYHPKRVVSDAVDNCIIHGDLTAALYAQGYRDSDFAN